MSRKTKPDIKSLGWTENCIFCGNPADSEEDAHPEWLMEWLKKNMYIDPNDAHPQRLPILERQVTVGGEVQAYEYKGESKVGVMCVCEKCNNGWMSLIQRDHGQRVLTRLLEEPYPILETADCRSLALWGVMTSMVLDALNNGPKYRHFAEVERCVFWKTGGIPDNIFIWIGPWLNSPGPSYVAHLLTGENGCLNGIVCTFGFGTVAMQVVKIIAGPLPTPRPGPWDEALLQVYPVVGCPITYPPHQAINDDDGIELLELRFSPPGADSGRAAADEALKRSTALRRNSGPRPGQSPPA